MLTVDLHSHSLFSVCGMCTYMELMNRAREIEISVLAITDHGKAVGGKIPGTFYERFKSPFDDLTVLKGIECNVIDEKGAIDLDVSKLKWIDIVLLGLHKNLPTKQSESINTDLLVQAILKNPSVDIITHPNDPNFPVDFRTIAQLAREKGIAVELNNSKIMYGRTTVERTQKMVEIFAQESVLLSVNSDTHAIHELGRDTEVRPIVDTVGYPEYLQINRTRESALAFVNERRINKA